jgi:hypothetical protein
MSRRPISTKRSLWARFESWVKKITAIAAPIALLLGFFLPETVSKKVAFVAAVVLGALFAIGTHRFKKPSQGSTDTDRRTNWGQIAAAAIVAAVLSAAIISARHEWRQVRIIYVGEQIVPGAGQEGGFSWRAPTLNQKKHLLAVAQSYVPNTPHIIILDVRSGTVVKDFEDKAFGELPLVGEEGRLAFSPDGEFLAIGGLDAGRETPLDTLWLVRTHDWYRMQLKTVSKENVSDVAFSSDDHSLASAQDRIYVWNLEKRDVAPVVLDATCGEGEEEFVHVIGDRSDFEGPLKPSRIDFSPDGTKILALYTSNVGGRCLRLWDIAQKRSQPIGNSNDLEGQNITDVYFDARGDPQALTFSDGGATGTKTNTLFHVFSLSENRRIFEFATGLSPFGDVLTAIDSSRSRIAVAEESKVQLFRLGKPLPQFVSSDRRPVGVTFSPDGRQLIICDRQRDSACFFEHGLWIFGMRIPWLP